MNHTSLLWEFWQWMQEWQFFHQLFPLGHSHLNDESAFQLFEQQFIFEQQAQMIILNEFYESATMKMQSHDQFYN